jgi:protein-L-isoaspartate(D-aspartate) O-methyltransferase
MDRLSRLRRHYARAILAAAGVEDDRLEAAFAATPREAFLGPAPWMVGREPAGYVATDDPAALYRDVLVALDRERGINNGQPSLHALALHALAAQPGEDAVHVGCGTGYYSAILARLVGADGHVEAIEIDPALAARAVTCLADLPWVFVAARNGTEGALPASDIIYVSAAAAAPARVWLDALREGGRLLFPLAPAGGSGGMLLVQRQGERLPAQFLPWRVSFIPCEGAQDGEAAERLRTALAGDDMGSVRSLRLGSAPDASCWVAGEGWWLSKEDEGRCPSTPLGPGGPSPP